jgi:hypothetical protein
MKQQKVYYSNGQLRGIMATAVKTKSVGSIKRTRKECPENLSKAGKWAMENPNGIFVIVNRRAVNK